jgi:CDP-diglyceride synthetase
MARRWLKVVVLLTIANGFPVIGGKLFDTQFSLPLDRGVVFVDGRPIFGQSKTIRGVVLSLLATAASAPVLPIWAPRIAEKL